MKRATKNVLAFVVGDAGGRFVGLWVTIYLARVLDPSGFGVMNIGLSMLGYLLLVGSPGIQTLEPRNVAAREGVDTARVDAILSMRLFFSVILVVLAWLVSTFVFFKSRETRDVVEFYSLSMVPLALFLDWFFQGKEHFVAISSSKITNALVYALCVFLLVHSFEDVRMTALAFGAGNVAASIVLLIFFKRRFGAIRLRWQPDAWRAILKANVPVGVATFFGQSVTNLPPLVIGFFATKADVGTYSAAMKVIYVLLLMDRVVNALLLPVVARYAASRREELPDLISTILKVLNVLVFPMALAGALGASTFIPFVFGPGYTASILVFQILVWYFAVTMMNSVFATVLIATGRERSFTRVMILGSIVTAMAIAILTGYLGTVGTALGVVLGEMTTTCLMTLRARRSIPFPFGRTLGSPLWALSAAGIVALCMQSFAISLVLLCSLTTYIAVLLLLKGVRGEEIRFLKERFV